MAESIQTGALVLYKSQAAHVQKVGDKIDLLLRDGRSKSVRPKDVILFHPGPLASLDDLQHLPEGEVEEAQELLAGSQTDLAEVAELVFGEYTPVTVWAAWELVRQGIAFYGSPLRIEVRSQAEAEEVLQAREKKALEAQRWSDFIQRLEKRQVSPEDETYLSDVEQVALGLSTQSRVLTALKRQISPDSAHNLLLEIKHWDVWKNPYPRRLDVDMLSPQQSVPDLPSESRRDLTNLAAYAIDDVGNTDPDDALSFDGERVWVHVADVAALAGVGSELDQESCNRGANVYLPEDTVTMMTAEVTEQLGLGLHSTSPALSFGFKVSDTGELSDLQITTSQVQVTRLSYDDVEEQLDQEPFATLNAMAQRFSAWRQSRRAVNLQLPEVQIKCRNREVSIRPFPTRQSRTMVSECMLMAGKSVADYAIEHQLVMPFVSQPPVLDETADLSPSTFSGMFALRRQLKRSRVVCVPEAHSGLGLDAYVRVTSPLRRYHDLVAHQQLRSHLAEQPLRDAESLLEAISSSDEQSFAIRRTERFSRQHWTLVYLMNQPAEKNWEGVVVENFPDGKIKVLIPELAMETRLKPRREYALDEGCTLKVRDIQLPTLDAYFFLV